MTGHPMLNLIGLFQVLESCVKNCGSLIHEEIATRGFMEELRELLKHNNDEKNKQKILEMLQTWGMAFRNSPRYRIVTVCHKTVTNRLKMSETFFLPAFIGNVEFNEGRRLEISCHQGSRSHVRGRYSSGVG